MTFELPSLPYASDALAPYMSSETLDFHHGKHHQTYVTNLNNLVKDSDMQDASLEDIVVKSAKTHLWLEFLIMQVNTGITFYFGNV
jgi:Fe-Mn family superoxide dismutase